MNQPLSSDPLPESPSKQIPASLNSLSSLEDSTSTLNTSTSLQQSNQEQANPPVSSSSKDDDISLKPEIARSKTKASTASPILLSFDDVYDRIEKFLDNEGLNITSPSALVLPQKQATILKPTIKLDTLNLVKFNSSPNPHIVNLECQSAGIPSIGTPGFGTPVAMPSFLAKRNLLQRSQSGKFAVEHSPVEVAKRSASDDLTFKPEKSSRFAKFSFDAVSHNDEDSEDSQ